MIIKHIYLASVLVNVNGVWSGFIGNQACFDIQYGGDMFFWTFIGVKSVDGISRR